MAHAVVTEAGQTGFGQQKARTRLERGRSLLDVGSPAATAQAAALLEQTRAAAAEMGMATVDRRATALLDSVGAS